MTLYAVRRHGTKLIVRAHSREDAGIAFGRHTGVGALSVDLASALPSEQLAGCEHLVTDEEARGLASRWADWRDLPEGQVPASKPGPLADIERARLYAWALDATEGDGEDSAVRVLLSRLGWEYHAGYGSPSYQDALALLRAARGGS